MSMTQQKQILVVEDHEINRSMLRAVLSDTYGVLEAENGQIALDILDKKKDEIALILLDVSMPVMDGYRATEEIRHLENPVQAGVPIVAMTANAFDEDKRKCMDIGMNGHIAKPLRIRTLFGTLNRILSADRQ